MQRKVRLATAAALISLGALAAAAPAAAPWGVPRAVAAQATSPARMMAVDAGLLFAQALRVGDAERRAELLDEAQAAIDKLLAEYPDSDEATKLRADEMLAGLSPSILAAAREAVRRDMEAAGLISGGDRDRCLARPTLSCLYDLAAVTAHRIDSKGRRIALLAEIAEARAHGGELDRAVSQAKPLAYGTPDGPGARALTEIAVLQAESGRLQDALETAAGLASRAATDNARARIVAALAAGGALEPAEELLARIEAKGPLLGARAALALARSGGPPAGQTAAELDGMIEAAHRLSDPRASDATLEGLALALVGAGDFARAAGAARQIIDPVRLRHAMTTVAERWAAAGAVREALKLARELGTRNGGARLQVRIAAVRLEAGDYGAVAAILDDEAGPEAGTQILNRVAATGLTGPQAAAWAGTAAGLTEPGERARGLAIAARALAEAGDTAAAEARLAEALTAATPLDDWERAPVMLEAAAIDLLLGEPAGARGRLTRVPAGTFWSDEVVGLSAALARMAEPEAVLEVVAGLADEDDRWRLLLIAAQSMAGHGEAERALALARALPAGSVRDQALFGIAKALAGAGADPTQAAEVFKQAVSLQGDQQLLLEFALAQAAAGDLRGALGTGERIAAPDAKARVYMALAERLRSPLAMQ